MSRPIYGTNEHPPPCVYTIPEGQNVQPYIQQLNTIITQFKASLNKTHTIEQIQTLKALMEAVRNNASDPD